MSYLPRSTIFRFPVAPVIAAFAALAATVHADFQLSESPGQLSVTDGEMPVFTYNFGDIEPPVGVDSERYRRASYIHPLHGIEGEVISEDFPVDHYHHRGVFWSWLEVRAEDTLMDAWTLIGVRQRFERWIRREVTESGAHLVVENAWYADDDPDAKLRETIAVRVHPVDKKTRAIDFHLEFENVSGGTVTFAGAPDKGYGGFNFRPIRDNRPFDFFTATGESKRDVLSYETPWASIGWHADDRGPRAGVALFQHPGNPGYPHPGWIFRHYGFLGACWPHEEVVTLAPGDIFELRYRMVVFSGARAEKRMGDRYEDYVRAVRADESD